MCLPIIDHGLGFTGNSMVGARSWSRAEEEAPVGRHRSQRETWEFWGGVGYNTRRGDELVTLIMVGTSVRLNWRGRLY